MNLLRTIHSFKDYFHPKDKPLWVLYKDEKIGDICKTTPFEIFEK